MNEIVLPAIGDVGHVRHLTFWPPICHLIHYELNHWHRDWCKRHVMHYNEVLGTHDFVIVPCPESRYGIGAGESLAAKGTVITPWEYYVDKAVAGELEAWIFDTGFSTDERKRCNDWWMENCLGTNYDMRGIFSFLLKITFESFSKDLRHNKYKFWCTESVAAMLKQVKNVFQVEYATPRTTEQICGWLARNPKMWTSLKLKAHVWKYAEPAK